MKIVKSCLGMPVAPKVLNMSDVKVGNVFRYCAHSCGPYLRVNGNQMIDLSENSTVPIQPDYHYTNIKILDKAYLVTGEE